MMSRRWSLACKDVPGREYQELMHVQEFRITLDLHQQAENTLLVNCIGRVYSFYSWQTILERDFGKFISVL